MEKGVTINIKESLWLELNKRKKAGESFHEVIDRLLQKEMSFYEICKKVKTVGELRKLTKEVLDDVQKQEKTNRNDH